MILERGDTDCPKRVVVASVMQTTSDNARRHFFISE
jgi:hypothetical protein